MKFKEFLKNFIASVKDGISRFLVAFICTVLAYLTVVYEIISEATAAEVIVPLCMAFALTAVLSVLLKLIQEYMTPKLNHIIQYISCSLVGVVSFMLIKINYTSLYMLMAYMGIIIALICFIFFVLMSGENRVLAFPKIVTSSIFAGAICGVLSSGLSTCITAVQSLLFSWNNIFKAYIIINLFVWMICFVNIFLSSIPKKDIPITQSKIFRVFVLFAGLPLYMLLIAILLIYLAKIIVTWNMPVGEINWFASFASLFFIFFLLSVMQYKEKIAKLFTKFGGYFLIPVLIMQAIAVFERINAYGLTTPRTVSLVLILISVLFIIGSIIIPKHLNKIALLSGIIVLIVTLTPFNVIDMPVKSQTKILEDTLTANDMLKDGNVIPNENVKNDDVERILSSYKYLKYNAEKVPDFIPDSSKTEKEIFGFEEIYEREENYIYCDFTTKEQVDISEYDKMVEFHFTGTNILQIDHNDQQYDIDLIQLAKDFYAQYGESKTDLDIYVFNEKISLYFNELHCTIKNDEITRVFFSGYALLKD